MLDMTCLTIALILISEQPKFRFLSSIQISAIKSPAIFLQRQKLKSMIYRGSTLANVLLKKLTNLCISLSKYLESLPHLPWQCLIQVKSKKIKKLVSWKPTSIPMLFVLI